jgi:hypothetical protein
MDLYNIFQRSAIHQSLYVDKNITAQNGRRSSSKRSSKTRSTTRVPIVTAAI